MTRAWKVLGMSGAITIVLGIGFWSGVAAQSSMLTAKEVYRKPLSEALGKEIRIVDLALPPGSGAPGHRHPGDTFVYVIEGEVQIGLNEDAPVTVKAGGVFHEPPMSLHTSTLNPSKTDKAHVIAIMIMDADKPSTVAPDSH